MKVSKCGVPRGSNLGPIQFIFYMNGPDDICIYNLSQHQVVYKQNGLSWYWGNAESGITESISRNVQSDPLHSFY